MLYVSPHLSRFPQLNGGHQFARLLLTLSRSRDRCLGNDESILNRGSLHVLPKSLVLNIDFMIARAWLHRNQTVRIVHHAIYRYGFFERFLRDIAPRSCEEKSEVGELTMVTER